MYYVIKPNLEVSLSHTHSCVHTSILHHSYILSVTVLTRKAPGLPALPRGQLDSRGQTALLQMLTVPYLQSAG